MRAPTSWSTITPARCWRPQNADARMEPASLTKLMTAYIVFQKLAAGKLKLE